MGGKTIRNHNIHFDITHNGEGWLEKGFFIQQHIQKRDKKNYWRLHRQWKETNNVLSMFGKQSCKKDSYWMTYTGDGLKDVFHPRNDNRLARRKMRQLLPCNLHLWEEEPLPREGDDDDFEYDLDLFDEVIQGEEIREQVKALDGDDEILLGELPDIFSQMKEDEFLDNSRGQMEDWCVGMLASWDEELY